MISQERFNEIEMVHGCGYYLECYDKGCPCAITTENKGLTEEIWNGFKEEQRKLSEEFEDDGFEYKFQERCCECGSFWDEEDLIDGMCFICFDEQEMEYEED